ncbi:MAG: four helix bundle protein [Vicingaceae bacterium]|nr:four helix bundle protein [Vicingaceae bacterium]
MKEVKVEQLRHLIEYKMYKKLSDSAWDILNSLNDENKSLFGNPFVKSIDSVGSNISKGFYQLNKDKRVNYYIDSKVVLSEAIDHWLELMLKRNAISKITYKALKEMAKPLRTKLDSRITAIIKDR